MKSSTIRRNSVTHSEKLIIEIAAWVSIFVIACIIAGVIL